MLATSSRGRERDGFVTRTIGPTPPPQVEYALDKLGRGLVTPADALPQRTIENAGRIDARVAYASREARSTPLRVTDERDLSER